MRRGTLVLLPLLAIAVLALASCDGGEEEPAVPEAPAEETEAPAEETETPTPETGAPTVSAERGETIARESGCLSCHTTDGAPSVGPTWQGLFGSEETLADGTTVTVDEAYLRESIVDPNAKIVEGFPEGVMPQDYGDTLSDSEVGSIIEYIRTLE